MSVKRSKRVWGALYWTELSRSRVGRGKNRSFEVTKHNRRATPHNSDDFWSSQFTNVEMDDLMQRFPRYSV